jgi:hypothetical protein
MRDSATRYYATGAIGRWTGERRAFFAEHFCDIGEWFDERHPANPRRMVVWGEIRDRWGLDKTRYGFPVLLKSRGEPRAALAAAQSEAQAFMDRWLDHEKQVFASDEVIHALGVWQ